MILIYLTKLTVLSLLMFSKLMMKLGDVVMSRKLKKKMLNVILIYEGLVMILMFYKRL